MAGTGRHERRDADSPGSSPTVPAPVPPDDPDAWYAPDVRSQAEVYPGVVATVRETERAFRYEVREPVLGDREARALTRVRDHFAAESRRRPLTREGARSARRLGSSRSTNGPWTACCPSLRPRAGAWTTTRSRSYDCWAR